MEIISREVEGPPMALLTLHPELEESTAESSCSSSKLIRCGQTITEAPSSQSSDVSKINLLASYLLKTQARTQKYDLKEIENVSNDSNTKEPSQQKDIEKESNILEVPSESASAPSCAENQNAEKTIDSEGGKTVTLDNKNNLQIVTPAIKEVLCVSTKEIDFGANYPGNTLEDSVEVKNKGSQDLIMQVTTTCLNPELEGSDDHVYCIRSNHFYDYSNKRSFIIKAGSSVYFRVMLKVPGLQLQDVLGEVQILVKSTRETHKVALKSSVFIPKIRCPKELYSSNFSYPIINLAIKREKKFETKFPIKNLSEIPVAMELRFFKPENIEEDPKFQCLLYPPSLVLPPNGLAILNFGLKNYKNFTKLAEDEPKSFKKIVIGTVKNSSLIYSFLLNVEFCCTNLCFGDSLVKSILYTLVFNK